MPEVPGRAPEKVGDRGPVIVVSGPPGSGKSTYARLLARDLGLRYVTTGMIFREMAARLGVSLEELSRRAARDPAIDLAIDKATVGEAAKGGVVIDSHLAAWVLNGVADVIIYVTAPLNVRIGRIASREGKPPGEVLEETLAREESQWDRFHAYYGYDTSAVPHVDLVVDTSTLTVEEVYNVIKSYVEAKLARLRGGEARP